MPSHSPTFLAAAKCRRAVFLVAVHACRLVVRKHVMYLCANHVYAMYAIPFYAVLHGLSASHRRKLFNCEKVLPFVVAIVAQPEQHAVDVCVVVKYCGSLLQCIVRIPVVGIEHADIFAFSLSQCHVACMCQPSVMFQRHHLYATVACLISAQYL